MYLSWFADRANTQIDERRNRVLLALIYIFHFGQLGVFIPYVGIYLDAKGFSSAQIGTLLAVVSLSRIVGPNMWAHFADKTGQVGEVLRLGCLLAFLSFSSILWVEGFIGITIAFASMMMFWTAVLPQLEVITSHATERSKGGYGAIRLWGSIGFIACTLVVGWLLDNFSAQVIVYASIVMLLGLFISSLLVVSRAQQTVTDTKTQDHALDAHSKMKIWSFGFIVFLLGNTFLQVSFGSFYNFFTLYMRALDYSGMQTGVFIGLGVAAEVIIFIYAMRLIKRFGVKSLLVFSVFFTALRWALLAVFAEHTSIIVFTQLIHALSFGLTHAASVYYLQQTFPKAFQSRAQALYVSIAFGIGGASGSYLSGLMWAQGEGALVSFAFAALIAFASGICMLALPNRA
ncbi:MFS transporter [Glaciecola siphonariae]|uniref:MFS transporter n=1 Tax=Glaciecola siphonariae TaxID=521012 RepID=A0ABV9LUE8_9ALTE